MGRWNSISRRGFIGSGLALVGGAIQGRNAGAESKAEIEGYTDRESYLPGDTIQFHISSAEPKFRIEIYRVGTDKVLCESLSRLEGQVHPTPETASSHGCGWPVTHEFTIPSSWKSGYYDCSLVSEQTGREEAARTGRRISFVVRSLTPGNPNPILLQMTTNTSNAYNNWGGFSLYAYNGRDNIQGRRVSFDRPQIPHSDTWEVDFIRWAERHGYGIDYAVNNDLEFHPEILAPYKLVLSVGHDEYWSAPMRDNLEAFIANGGNVAFLSGNTCCWQIRNEDEGRGQTSWKQSWKEDPLYRPEGPNPLLSSLWSHYLIDRPENKLTGVGFLYGGFHRSHGQFMDGAGAFTVHRPDHWVFEGTKLGMEDLFGGKDTIVGYECDGCQMTWRNGKPTPTYQDGTHESFEILATAPARWHRDDCEWYDQWEKGRTGAATLGLYTVPSGGTVFTAATTDWSHGLRGNDPIVEVVTHNVMKRLLS